MTELWINKVLVNLGVAAIALLFSQAALLVQDGALAFTLNAVLFHIYLLASLAAVGWILWAMAQEEMETA
jgi:hypothetical protein